MQLAFDPVSRAPLPWVLPPALPWVLPPALPWVLPRALYRVLPWVLQGALYRVLPRALHRALQGALGFRGVFGATNPPITQIPPIRPRLSQHQDTKNTKSAGSRRQAPTRAGTPEP
jgi:hypothetical protein